MFVKLLILSLIFLAIAGLAFGIRMLIRPKEKFPELHISGNKEMAKRGITCASRTDVGCHSTDGYPGCACGKQDY
jgi:hypothetical protein